MLSPSKPCTSGPPGGSGLLLRAGRSPWLGWLLFSTSALGFAAFVRVTLYGWAERAGPGARGLLVPAALLLLLLLWLLAASRLVGARPSLSGWAHLTLRRWLAPDRGGTQGASVSEGEPLLEGRIRFLLVAATFLPMLSTLPITLGVIASVDYAREYWIDRSVKVELLLGLPALVLALQAGLWSWFHYRLTWRRGGPILAILAAGFALRYAGMGWGLPFAFQPEEASIYFRWGMEVALHGQWNPNYFQNPSLLIYVLGFEFAALFALGRALQFGQDPGELYMVFRGEQDLFYAVGRLNSVLLGTATIFVVYLIARRLWSERAGLLAAALLAANFLHVRNSQYAVNDVPSTFFLALSLYYALRLAEDGRNRHYLLAGLMAGLAASTKYNAGLIAVAVAAGHWVRHGGTREMLRRGALAGLGLSALLAVAGFFAGTPYAALDFPAFRNGFLEQLGMGQAAWSGQSLAPTAWQFSTGIVQGAGAVAAALALLGGVLLLARDRGRAAILLSFPTAYFVFMSLMDLFFVRWVVPAVPFVALLAAYGMETALTRVAADGRRRLATTILILIALAQPALYSARLDWLAHQRDTRHEANAWAEVNLPPGSNVAVEAFSLLDLEALTFRATLQSLDVELFWRATMHDLDYYRENGFDYLAVSSFMYDRAFTQPERYPDRVEFYQRLDRELPLVAIFHPRSDGGPVPFALDDTDTPFWHLFSYDRPGPTVKVYRLSE